MSWRQMGGLKFEAVLLDEAWLHRCRGLPAMSQPTGCPAAVVQAPAAQPSVVSDTLKGDVVRTHGLLRWPETL